MSLRIIRRMAFSSADIDRLFINNTPLIDVRSPVEFAKGAFPSAVNLPILDDRQREQIGICYSQDGPIAARELGHHLVSGDTREQRIQAWEHAIKAHPDALLYCFRGGQRSQIACDWLAERGMLIDRIPGGYKQLRNHLIAVLDRLPPLIIIAGKTGTGKTQFLAPYKKIAIDLEAIAHHRGSAFGGYIDAQPSQIDFENKLAIEFLKRRDEPHVLLEDEGRLIGRIHMPIPLQEKMKQSPLLLIEESVDIRARRIHGEYIIEQWQSYQHRYPEDAEAKFEEYLLTAIDAIRKRLGNVAHGEVREQIILALAAQHRSGDAEEHLVWIERLLREYYDPMYEYQLTKKRERILARGNHAELSNWLTHKVQTA